MRTLYCELVACVQLTNAGDSDYVRLWHPWHNRPYTRSFHMTAVATIQEISFFATFSFSSFSFFQMGLIAIFVIVSTHPSNFTSVTFNNFYKQLHMKCIILSSHALESRFTYIHSNCIYTFIITLAK